jgi:hypothetical protein
MPARLVDLSACFSFLYLEPIFTKGIENVGPDIGPRIEHVLKTGEATWDEGLLLQQPASQTRLDFM